MDKERPYLSLKIVARRTGEGTHGWEVGYSDGLRSTDKSFGQNMTSCEAEVKARLVNSVIEKFISVNAIPTFKDPLLRRATPEIQSHAWDDQAFIDLMQEWLTLTNRFEQELEGSLVEEIKIIKNHIVRLLRITGFKLKGDDGIWIVKPPPDDER